MFQHVVLRVECLQMNDGSWNSCWWRRLMMTAAAAEWIHPSDWWFTYTFRLLSKLSAALVCQTDSITAALLLWRGSVSVGSRSLGLWRPWLLLMFSRHRLAFHRAVSQRPEASYERRVCRERDQRSRCQDSSGVCDRKWNLSVWPDGKSERVRTHNCDPVLEKSCT